MCGEDNEEKAGKVGGRIVRVWGGEWEEWGGSGRSGRSGGGGVLSEQMEKWLGERRSGLEKEGA
jgi:hypothetical protein